MTVGGAADVIEEVEGDLDRVRQSPEEESIRISDFSQQFSDPY